MDRTWGQALEFKKALVWWADAHMAILSETSPGAQALEYAATRSPDVVETIELAASQLDRSRGPVEQMQAEGLRALWHIAAWRRGGSRFWSN